MHSNANKSVQISDKLAAKKNYERNANTESDVDISGTALYI